MPRLRRWRLPQRDNRFGHRFIWTGKRFNRVRKCLSGEPNALICLPIGRLLVGKCFIRVGLSLFDEPKCQFDEPDGSFGVGIGWFGAGETFFQEGLDKFFCLN
jgi:hypothetical protein